MAKLVDVYRNDKQKLARRQLPLVVDDNLTMVMDLNSMGFVYDNQTVKGKELEEFLEKYKILSYQEVRSAFQVTCKDILTVLGQTIPCVGCRRSVERLFYQLMKSGHPALEPIIITSDGILTIQEDHFTWPHLLCTLLHGHSSTRLNDLVESQSRSKKSRRCVLHSLDSQRTRALTTSWRDIWSIMRPQCRDEVVLIEASTLLTTLESYLRKHRFCGECRTKVLRAYSLLVEEPEPTKEKGYMPGLYAGIKRCLPDKHIHLQTETEYISNLISRAEPELTGSRRERHAKTLEIAQEEVLTCLGICVYERLHRIQLRLKEEECTCQVLAAIAIDGLCRNFEVAVELKRGISQLELLYEELTKEEQLKQQRREHKKLRRKKRKEKKAELEEKENYEENCECESEEQNEPVCEHVDDDCSCFDEKPPAQHVDRQKLQVLHRKPKGTATCTCVDCQQRNKKKKNSLMSPIKSQGDSKRNIATNPKQRGIQQKQDKKAGKERSGNSNCNSSNNNNNSTVTTLNREDNNVDHNSLSPCQSCFNAQELLNSQSNSKHLVWSSVEQSQDCGYSSENNTCNSNPSSPDGSEIACSEGFCNHEGDCQSESGVKEHDQPTLKLRQKSPVKSHTLALSLQQMLEPECFVI
ncbi:gametogenetin-binding protein 2 isoform X2 [Lycorma delicatula]|uniref:gametogenetin-binding protein 2 isoform X2 n=1 Tax=Lycorma delicatula TaxID=130591 RepID=UPI003F51AA66